MINSKILACFFALAVSSVSFGATTLPNNCKIKYFPEYYEGVPENLLTHIEISKFLGDSADDSVEVSYKTTLETEIPGKDISEIDVSFKYMLSISDKMDQKEPNEFVPHSLKQKDFSFSFALTDGVSIKDQKQIRTIQNIKAKDLYLMSAEPFSNRADYDSSKITVNGKELERARLIVNFHCIAEDVIATKGVLPW